MKKLNEQQEKFVRLYGSGKFSTQAEAYFAAGYKPRNKGNAERAASRVLSSPEAQVLLEEIRGKARERCVRTREKLMGIVWGIAEDKEEQSQARLQATAQIAKMEGWNEPEKLNISGDFASLLASLPRTHQPK